MIYVDTSVVLAELLAEDQRAPEALWRENLITSRLSEYETWTRVNALGASKTLSEHARALLARLSFVELAPSVLARALEPWPKRVRTLDALHLATQQFLAASGQPAALATFDLGMRECAQALQVSIYDL